MRKLFIILFALISYNSFCQVKNAANLRKFDIQFTDIHWNIDPNMYYIAGTIKNIISINGEANIKIDFDLNNSLLVDSVFLNGKKSLFEHQSNKIFVQTSGSAVDTFIIFYQGKPGSSGFESFTKSSHNNQPIVWTLSEPYGAVDWWPTRNNLEDKTDSLRIAITCPESFMGISNGLLTKVLENQNQTKTYIWEHKHPIAMYLVAFAVTNFAQFNLHFAQHQADSVLVENYVYPEDSAFAAEEIKKLEPAFTLFSEYYGEYPFANEKYGHAQFGWGGGMEHQTVSFVSNFDFYLLAHELAHQWFGDFVTCGSFKDIWLNEGYAVFSEGLVTQKLISELAFTDWKRYRVERITAVPGGSLYVNDTSNIWRIFDGRLTYSKGGMVLQMLRSQIGDEAFFAATRNYLKDPKIQNSFAETDDLQKHFETASGQNLEAFFQQWIYEEGYPIYTLNYSFFEKSAQIILHQKPSTQNGPVFDLKLPFLIQGVTKDSLIWIRNTEIEQIYTLELDFEPIRIKFNPNYDIVSKWSENMLVFEQNEVLLYPNPANDSLGIVLKKPTSTFQYKIFNSKGQLMKKSEENISNPHQINVSELRKGNYFMEIVLEGKNIKLKFVKI